MGLEIYSARRSQFEAVPFIKGTFVVNISDLIGSVEHLRLDKRSFERSNIGRPAQLLRTLEDTIDWFEANSKKGTEDTLARAEIRNRLASWRVEVEMLRMLCYRVGWMQSQGLVPQRESSMVKATGDELFQRIYRGIAQIMGGYGKLLPTNGPNYKLPVNDFLPARGWQSIGTSIGGGTREIQKNIIAQRGLGLPR